MKIQLASDLHLEFLRHTHPAERLIEHAPEADVLVLAGDIANGVDAIRLFADWPVPVVYLPGNHEFYRHSFDRLRMALRQAAQGTNVHVLDPGVVEFDGVRMIGCTLWTDYRLGPASQAKAMDHAERSLNDHRLILRGADVFTAQAALDEHDRARAWLREELEKPFDGRRVVVTHHGPHPQSTHPRYREDPLNAAFNSDLSDLLPMADLWLHGHVHDSFDYSVDGCRVVANPRGYVTNLSAPRDKWNFENAAFKERLVLEV